MLIGKELSPYDDYSINDLIEINWIYMKYGSIIDDEHIVWMEENFKNVHTDVRWLSSIGICFRRKEDAMAFKLRWT